MINLFCLTLPVDTRRILFPYSSKYYSFVSITRKKFLVISKIWLDEYFILLKIEDLKIFTQAKNHNRHRTTCMFIASAIIADVEQIIKTQGNITDNVNVQVVTREIRKM